MTQKDLQSLIQVERQTRAERCLVDVQAAIGPILKRHHCQLVATPQITPDGRVVASWGVAALELLPS